MHFVKFCGVDLVFMQIKFITCIKMSLIMGLNIRFITIYG